MPNPLNVPITPPRVAFIDPRTGNVSREWYMFFLSLFQSTGGSSVSLDDLQKGPPALTIDEINTLVDKASENLRPSSESVVEQIAELQKQIEGLAATPIPALGTFAALQQNNLPWTTFDTTPESVPTTVGTLAWDGGTTLGLQATTDVTIRIGESEFIYVKASSAITKGQLCYHTGSVGSSGVITAAPTPLALADPNQIVGVAAETIALNGFGLIQISGDLRGFNTTGSSVGETWADGDPLYYNPAYVGSMTKVKPSAPNQKSYIGEVINAGSAGSGSMHIRIVPGSVLGGTDSNVQFGTLANGDLIQYDSVLGYWKNVPASTLPVGTATNLAGGAAGSIPYQSAPSTTAMLPIGAAGRWLGSSGTLPQWNAPAALTKTDDTNVTLTLGGSASTALLNAASLTLNWTGTLAATRGGTGFGSYAVGDILYADTTTTLAKLPDVATGNALISGGVGVAPAWGKIGLTTHVSGTLPVANGGTGITSFGSGVATWLGTPSSANLAAAVTDETGSGALVFGTAPTISDLTVTGTGGNVFSGTYTPTLTNTTNVSASTAVLTAYTRVADSVIISGRVSVTTTATGSFTLGISLPIASNLQVVQDAVGPCASSNATHVGLIRANTTTDVMEMVANATSTAATVVAWSATYRIR